MIAKTDLVAELMKIEVSSLQGFRTVLQYLTGRDVRKISVTENSLKSMHISGRICHVCDGDCNVSLKSTDGSVLIINGDLFSHLELGNRSEVVIVGTVHPSAKIECSGSIRCFTSGDFRGAMRAHGSLNMWIKGEVSGEIGTGSAQTRISIGNDLIGKIHSLESKGSMLGLVVGGFASYENMEEIMAFNYTMFDAVVRFSDVEPGAYPTFEFFTELALKRVLCTLWVTERLEKNSN